MNGNNAFATHPVRLVPDPFLSDREYARFYHLDLSDLSDMALRDELHHLRFFLWGLESNHWLRERVKELEAEMKRRENTGHESRSGQRLNRLRG